MVFVGGLKVRLVDRLASKDPLLHCWQIGGGGLNVGLLMSLLGNVLGTLQSAMYFKNKRHALGTRAFIRGLHSFCTRLIVIRDHHFPPHSVTRSVEVVPIMSRVLPASPFALRFAVTLCALLRPSTQRMNSLYVCGIIWTSLSTWNV